MKNINLLQVFSLNQLYYTLIIMCSFIFLVISGCTDFEEPILINNPDVTYSTSPVITSVTPANIAAAGVREITITGQNFAVNGVDTNWIFVGGSPAVIKSAAQDKIVIYRPRLGNDRYGVPGSLSITNPNGLEVAKVDYQVESPGSFVGDYSNVGNPFMAVEIDNQENQYVGARRLLYRADRSGLSIQTLANLPAPYVAITDMKFGPGGYLYIMVDRNEIRRFNTATNTESLYLTLPEVSTKLDFDENDNLYTAKTGGIYVVHPADSTVFSTGRYSGNSVDEIRVFDGYVYVSIDSSIISKNKILDAQGNLGENETVLNIQNISNVNNCKISSFALASDGTIYLCLKHHTNYSVFIRENDGSITPFYADTTILPYNVDKLVWATDNNIYLIDAVTRFTSNRLFRMEINKAGAPYYGRRHIQ